MAADTMLALRRPKLKAALLLLPLKVLLLPPPKALLPLRPKALPLPRILNSLATV